jgi:hypothetical protein
MESASSRPCGYDMVGDLLLENRQRKGRKTKMISGIKKTLKGAKDNINGSP